MITCCCPDLSTEKQITSIEEAHELADQWIEEGASEIFDHEGARLRSVGLTLKGFAREADTETIQRVFDVQGRAAFLAGSQRLRDVQWNGSIEGKP